MSDDMANEPDLDIGTEPNPHAGFSTSEKVLAGMAAWKAPLLSGLAASALIRREPDPARRKQLETLRTAALVWWGASALLGIVAFAVALIWISSHDEAPGGDGAPVTGACQGEPVEYAPIDGVYESDDNVHWKATFPCTGGGSTQLPVPANQMPKLAG